MTVKAFREPDPNVPEISWTFWAESPVFMNPYTPSFYTYDGKPLALLAPASQWSTETQEELYLEAILPYIYDNRNQNNWVDGVMVPPPEDANQTSMSDVALGVRELVPDLSAMEVQITDYAGRGFYGFGIYAPTPETAIIFHSAEDYNSQAGTLLPVLNLVTDRIANASGPQNARHVTAKIYVMVSESSKLPNNSILTLFSGLLRSARISATCLSPFCLCLHL